ncbi:MAG: protocatechuate 3,4-dioxygenase [Nitrospinae bacterium]|nr:protocatechuate 3,4-dioxygenase [Nitrospinota bacterium]
MSVHRGMSRRHVLGMAAAVGGLALSGGVSAVLAQALRRTPGQILGPFYPVLKPLDQDADLTSIAGKPGRAEGQVIHVMGRVVNLQGQPVQGARVEIWQANTHGRYNHPSDTNPAPLDPHFEGFAVLTTDAEGRYRFKTIKPGAYPAGPDLIRPPHIHFEVTGKSNRLVTQMYFAGEPLNDKDPFLQSAGASKERLIVPLQPPTQEFEPDSLVAVWAIVLDKG